MIEYIDFQESSEEERKLIQQYRKALSLLKERYRLEEQRLVSEFKSYGWENLPEKFEKGQENLALFLGIKNSYLRSQNKSREFYFERLLIQFPKISRKTIDLIDSILEKQIHRRDRYLVLKRSFEREKRELRQKAEEQIMNLLNKRLAETKLAVQKLQTHQEVLRVQEELEERRKIFEAKQYEKQKELKEMEKRRLEQEKRQKE